MKSFGIIAALLLVAVVGINGRPDRHPPFTEEMKKNFDECRTELGLTEEEVHKMHRHHDDDNEKMHCMSACLMKKDGFLEEDNELNIEKMVETAVKLFEAEPVRAKEIIEECAEKAEDIEEECDFANKVNKCTHKKMWREFKQNRPPHGGPHGPFTEEMKKNFKECKEELGITEEEEKELHRKHDFNNEKMRCMPVCLMKKEAFVGADGTINVEKILEAELERHPNQNKEAMEEIIEKCAKEAKEEAEDECDVALKFFHCKHVNKPRQHKKPEEE